MLGPILKSQGNSHTQDGIREFYIIYTAIQLYLFESVCYVVPRATNLPNTTFRL